MIQLADSTASTNPLLPSWPEFIIGTILFVLVFGALAKFLLPRAQQTLAERTELIEGGLARSEEAQAEAKQLLDQYRAAAGRGPARGGQAPRGGQGAGRADHRRDARAGPGRGAPGDRGRPGPDPGRAAAGAERAARRGRDAGDRAGQPDRGRVAHRRGPAEAGWWTGSSTNSSRCPAREADARGAGPPGKGNVRELPSTFGRNS